MGQLGYPDEFGFFDHRVLNWLEIQGDDWEAQYYQIVNFLALYDVLAVAVDSNGVGDAAAQRLDLLLPRAEVIPVTSSQVEQSRRWKHLQSLIQREMIGWPAHSKTRRLKNYQRFMQQMTDAEKKFSGQHFTVEAPDEAGRTMTTWTPSRWPAPHARDPDDALKSNRVPRPGSADAYSYQWHDVHMPMETQGQVPRRSRRVPETQRRTTGTARTRGTSLTKFGPVLSPRVQDSIFRGTRHKPSLKLANRDSRVPLYTGKAYRHAHVYDVLDHLGY